MSDFTSTFQSIEEFLRLNAGNVMSKIDQITFKMLINCLKNPDFQVITEALDQLEREKRPISIPPIYFLSKAHPDPRIRAHSANALKTIDPDNESEKIAGDKSPKEAVRALIEHYGNFRK